VRFGELAAAGQSTAFADGSEILKLAHCPTCSSLPSRLYLDHSHGPVFAPATLAALPSTRAIPNRDVFYVADPISSVGARSFAFPSFQRSPIMHHKRLTMQQTRRVARESSASLPKSKLATGRVRPTGGLDWALRPRNSMSDASNQLPAAALARARRLQAARKAFISARNTIIRVATPLYFFVVPVTVRLTAPW
jgi:hypothetical protein